MGRGLGRWAVPIGELFGTRVRVHWTFLILFLWMAWEHGGEARGTVEAFALTLALVACLVVHEAAHAAVARIAGVSTAEVVLYPIGGVARLERPLRPLAELLCAAAGPLAQLGVVVILAVLPSLMPAARAALLDEEGLLMRLVAANAIIVVVNLAPVWPLDGGRFIRSALVLALGSRRAPLVAARVGQGFGLLVALVGILLPPLILLGGVLFLGATQDANHLSRSRGLEHLRAGDAMIRRFETLPPHQSLGEAGERLLGSTQRDFPVIDGWGRLAGLLTRARLLAGLDRIGPDGSVGDAMERELRVVDIATPLDRVADALFADPTSALVVLEQGRVAGLITAERLAEVVALGEHVGPRSEG